MSISLYLILYHNKRMVLSEPDLHVVYFFKVWPMFFLRNTGHFTFLLQSCLLS
jgi:hypothetical protein